MCTEIYLVERPIVCDFWKKYTDQLFPIMTIKSNILACLSQNRNNISKYSMPFLVKVLPTYNTMIPKNHSFSTYLFQNHSKTATHMNILRKVNKI